jgi:hypothetical protein
MSVDTFERKVQPFIKVVPCGALVLVPPDELRRWARENSRFFLNRPPDGRSLGRRREGADRSA